MGSVGEVDSDLAIFLGCGDKLGPHQSRHKHSTNHAILVLLVAVFVVLLAHAVVAVARGGGKEHRGGCAAALRGMRCEACSCAQQAIGKKIRAIARSQ